MTPRRGRQVLPAGELRADATTGEASAGALSLGAVALGQRLADLRAQLLAPPPRLRISEWADRYRVVSSYSADPGAWQTARTPYLREIMDALGDPAVQMVAVQKCARIGGTEAGLNVVGYYIHQDPSTILIVQPTVDDAKDFSKEQLAPMIADTAVLRDLVREPRSRDSGNTVTAKLFPGGALYLVGANSARGFRRRTARVLILEEIDAYPASAGSEGDPISLAIRRSATFGPRRKIYLNSTPTLAGESRIEHYAAGGDQRRYQVACPTCRTWQHLVWRQLQYAGRQEPVYVCPHCHAEWSERSKGRIVAEGRWVAAVPTARYRSYYLSALYSPWVTWSELVAEWIDAQQDVTRLQTFLNTALGEVWEDRAGGPIDMARLVARTEPYLARVPAPVAVLTAGIDIQDDRLEYVVRGWGAAEESWLITWDRILGSPSDPAVWQALDQVLRRPWPTAVGPPMVIAASAIDTGAHTEAVYAYCRPRLGWRLFPLKGSSTPGAPLVPRRASRNNRGRLPLYLIGTVAAKDLIYSRLRITAPGPGYLHYPDDLPAEYFEQILAEVLVRRQVAGRWQRRYELRRGARNEALDCEVYALAALYLAPLDRRQLGPLAAQRQALGPAAPAPAGPTVSAAPPADPPPSAAPGEVKPAPAAIPRRPIRPSRWVVRW